MRHVRKHNAELAKKHNVGHDRLRQGVSRPLPEGFGARNSVTEVPLTLPRICPDPSRARFNAA